MTHSGTSDEKPPSAGSSRRRRAAQVSITAVFWVGSLFVGAGRLDWTRGWILVALYILGLTAASVVVRRTNPTLFEARSNWRHKDTKPFDKIFLGVYFPLAAFQPALAGMDSERFAWSSMPFAAVYPGIVLFAWGMAVIIWVMSVNRFAETTVRIQTDRGHTVVRSGPYRFVRHPMYVGAILLYLATPLLLGSMWALLPTALIVVAFIWRTTLEDRTLRRELPGYQEYTELTRYRLVPSLW